MNAVDLRQEVHYSPDDGRFTRLVKRGGQKAGSPIGWPQGNGYLYANVCGGKHALHRLAWLYVHGEWPERNIDHIDRDKLNNRIENLRDVSQRENTLNTGMFSHNTSGFKGVYWHKPTQNWMAGITRKNKLVCLGYFKDKMEAAAARHAAERECTST